MTDRVSKGKRSLIMSRVRGKETKPEILVRKLLFSKGFRFRKNVKSLPGNPDIVLPKYKTLIFVHGCFWHQHEGCRKARRPTTRIEFWNEKLNKNIERDAKNIKLLEDAGWKIIIVWECELKNMKEIADKLINTLKPDARQIVR